MTPTRETSAETRVRLESEGWGLSRKILFIVFFIIVLFTVVLSVVVGISSSRNLQKLSQASLTNMARIFSDTLIRQASDLEGAATRIIHDRKMKVWARKISELGPYYFLEKGTVGDRRMDSELVLFLGAQLELVGELKFIVETSRVDTASVYLTSPYGGGPAFPPVLAVQVNRHNIQLGRFNTIGSLEDKVYYGAKTERFVEPSPDAFKVDTIYSTTPEEQYLKMGFAVHANRPDLSELSSAPHSEKVESEIVVGETYPGIRVWSPLITLLPNPATLEEEECTVGWLLLEMSFDQDFLVGMSKNLGVHTGILRKGRTLIGNMGTTSHFKLYNENESMGIFRPYIESEYLSIDDDIYNYALLPIPLENNGKKEKQLDVVTFSPVAQVAEMTKDVHTRIFVSACVIILLSTVIVYLTITNFIHRPLNYLKEGVEQLKKGKLDHRVEVKSVDELGYLSRAFNEMAAELKDKNDELYTLLRELRLAQSYVKNIIDSMPSMLIGVDVNGHVTQWNMQATKVTGISADKAQGRLLKDVVPQMAIEIERIRRAISIREPEKELRKAMNIDGEVRFSDVAIYPLVANGVAGAVIRVDDVTESVRLQEMMIQSEKMLSIGGLAAGMAHEINNPLAGILQNLQVAQNRFKPEMPKNTRIAVECGTDIAAIDRYLQTRDIYTMLDAVRESGMRAAKIVDNMLSFSRKSDSQFVFQSLSEVVDNTIELAGSSYDLKKKYDFRKIDIVREYEEGLPNLPCDRVKLQQVILNILENGAQAFADHANQEEQPCFTVRLFRNEDMGCIEIEDNGSGMEEEVRRRVFEPFFTTKEVGQGTGLGLSVSYFIITENHYGTMNVESIVGKGSKFIIMLPLKQEH